MTIKRNKFEIRLYRTIECCCHTSSGFERFSFSNSCHLILIIPRTIISLAKTKEKTFRFTANQAGVSRVSKWERLNIFLPRLTFIKRYLFCFTALATFNLFFAICHILKQNWRITTSPYLIIINQHSQYCNGGDLADYLNGNSLFFTKSRIRIYFPLFQQREH